MDEPDARTFDVALQNFMSQLRNDPDTAVFLRYFEAH